MRRVIIKTPFPIEKGETRVDHKGLFLPRLYLSNGGSANRSSFRGPRYYITAYLFPRPTSTRITMIYIWNTRACILINYSSIRLIYQFPRSTTVSLFRNIRKKIRMVESKLFFLFFFFVLSFLPSLLNGQPYPAIFYFANHDRCWWIIAVRQRCPCSNAPRMVRGGSKIRRICVHVYSRVGK